MLLMHMMNGIYIIMKTYVILNIFLNSFPFFLKKNLFFCFETLPFYVEGYE